LPIPIKKGAQPAFKPFHISQLRTKCDFHAEPPSLKRKFKSNVRETWRVILVSEADIFHTESLRILAECLSQSRILAT
ncbi:hypothetical protein, partial [uncultured Clostridium sp.]|uniref:hypothetical protein n=1 Tax=uncultured Clostridium sp. TaxID=59620 RepID=UPI0025ED0D0A